MDKDNDLPVDEVENLSILKQMKKARLAILASGRGSNTMALIAACNEPGFPAEVTLVISDNENAPVLEKARNMNVGAVFLNPGPKKTYLIPEIEEKWVKVLREHEIDYVLLAGFMRILKKTILEAFPRKILNIHPALLPSFKGLKAQQQAWEYGVRYTGATVHFVDDSLDGGQIILQEVVEVRDDDSVESLSARILEAEHRIYPLAVKLVVQGQLEFSGRRVKILKNPKEKYGE